MAEKQWRNLTAEEKQLLKRLLAVEPELAQGITKRLNLIEAKRVDNHGCLGCLEFRDPNRGEYLDPSPYYQAIIDAEYLDSDGIRVEVTLFIRANTIKFLEFNKPVDPIFTWPDPEKLIVLTPGPNKSKK